MSAATAPLIPAVKFVDPTKVFGLASAAGDILYGRSDGGLAVLSAGADKSTLMFGTSGSLSATTAPTFAGVVTGEGGLVATAGGVTATAGGVTATAGNIVASAGSVSANTTVTGGTGVIATAGGLQAGGITVGATTGLVATAGNGNLTVSLGSGKLLLTSSAAIEDATQLATKSYVDSVASGLDVKQSVRTKTSAALPSFSRTGNVITASGNGALASVGGVTLVQGNRLLVDQLGVPASGASAGIYVVTTVGDGSNPYVLTRSSDANSDALVTGGMFVFVDEGTYASQGHVLTTDDPITLNTTELVFSQFSGTASVPGATADVIFNSGGSLAVDTGGFTYAGTGATGTLAVGKTLKSVSGQPLALFSHTGSLTSDRVYVGGVTNQGSTGDSVAFGLSSAASAAEAVAIGASSVASGAGAIALGAAARAVIDDTFNVAAIPIGRSYSQSGLGSVTHVGAAPVLATSMAVLSSTSFDGKTAGTAVATLAIPASTLFFPLGAIIWCSAFSASGSTHDGTYTATIRTAGSGATPAATTLATIDMATQPDSIGASRIQWSTTTNVGVTGTININLAVTGTPSDSYSLRVGLIGFLIENE